MCDSVHIFKYSCLEFTISHVGVKGKQLKTKSFSGRFLKPKTLNFSGGPVVNVLHISIQLRSFTDFLLRTNTKSTSMSTYHLELVPGTVSV